MYKEKRLIELCDCDYLGHMTLDYLFTRFGEIATKDAYQLGYYRDDMFLKYGWIVSKQTLKLTRPVLYGEVLEFMTNVGKASHVIFPRHYELHDNKGCIGICESTWTLFDLQKRRFIRPQSIGITVPTNLGKYDLPETLLPLDSQIYKAHYDVKTSDIDTNGHMNNVKYIRVACDLLPFEIYKTYFISEISINYKKEIAPLSTIDFVYNENNHHYHIDGYVNQELCFSIELQLKSLK